MAAPPPRARCSFGEKNQIKIKITQCIYMSRRYASRRYAGGLGPSRIRTRIPTTRQLGQWVSLRKILRFRVRLQLSQSRCLSLLLAMSGRVFLFLPPRGHEPPPTLRDRLNPNLSLYRHRFPIPRYAKCPDVALYTVGPLFLLPTPSSTHCALKVSEHDSLCLAGLCFCICSCFFFFPSPPIRSGEAFSSVIFPLFLSFYLFFGYM